MEVAPRGSGLVAYILGPLLDLTVQFVLLDRFPGGLSTEASSLAPLQGGGERWAKREGGRERTLLAAALLVDAFFFGGVFFFEAGVFFFAAFVFFFFEP